MTKDAKDFPYPLNTDIEEQIPVKKVRFDEKSNKLISTYELETRRTRYIDAPREHIRCKSGEHEFKVINGGEGLFQCIKCPFQRKVYPTTHKYVNGKLINKITNIAV